MNVRKLTMAALLIALGVVTAHAVSIPVGVARAFPMQHAINVVSAVILGTPMTVAVAFIVSLIRNIMGTGSLLAFPGSIFGAFLAGYLFSKTGRMHLVIAGEVLGTSILGAVFAYPIAKFLMGFESAVLFFVIPFGVSAVAGGIIGFMVLGILYKSKVVKTLIEGGRM